MRALVTVVDNPFHGHQVVVHARILHVDGIECRCGWRAVWELAGPIPKHARSDVFNEHLEIMGDLQVPLETRLAVAMWEGMRRKKFGFDDFVDAVGWPRKKAMAFLAGAGDDFTLTDLAHAYVALDMRLDMKVVDAVTGVGRDLPEYDDGIECGAEGCPNEYYCPTVGEEESGCHGGFDVCCAHPELHEPIL